MNKLIIIGNLVRDPEVRTVGEDVDVCTFTVAVNRRVAAGAESKADYVRVTAWRELGSNCSKYLSKGKKVCCIGSISAHAYNDNNGVARAALEMNASEVEFLTPRGALAPEEHVNPDGSVDVADDDIPF